jgi:uncharacterized protein YbjT (DUF2867 family)
LTHLVLGATGFVGRALTRALANSPTDRVRAASRRPPGAGEGSPHGVEWVRCDVRDAKSLPRVLEGIDCVYYLVHNMGDAAREGFRAAERESANNVVRAVAKSGCRRLVYLGGVDPGDRPSEHLASRLEVGAILRGGEVPTVELRAAMVVGSGSASWRIVRDLALRLPFMLLPRWLESKSCPIALEDVVTALVDAKDLPLDGSVWFDIPGPEVLRARELLMTVGDLCGRRIPFLKVPLLTPRLSAHWLKLVSGANYAVARELVLGLQEDLLPRDARYWDLTGHPPASTFREAARAALDGEAHGRGASAWLAAKEEQLVASLGRRREA